MSYDLTQLIGFNFNGVQSDGVDIANVQNGDPANIAYVPGTTTYNTTPNDYGGSQSDAGAGPNNVEEQVTAASNGTRIDGTPLVNPLALGQIVLTTTNNNYVEPPLTYDVLGYSSDGTTILIGLDGNYQGGATSFDPYGGQSYILSNANIDVDSPTAPYTPPALITYTADNAYTGGPFFETSTPNLPGNATLANVGSNADVVSVTNALNGVLVPSNQILTTTSGTGVTQSGVGTDTPFGDGGYILHFTQAVLGSGAQTLTIVPGGATGPAGQPLLKLGTTFFFHVVGFNTTQILLQGAGSNGAPTTRYYVLANTGYLPTANSTTDLNIAFQNYGAAPIVGEAIPCFVAGTRIATPSGEVAVESLQVGDLVTTISGAATPVVWLGNAIVHPRRHVDPARVRPVRVAAGAFGDAGPSRDLFLSPDHAVFIDDMLVPIKELLNNDTIRQVDVGVVRYFHVELEQHDVLLADGLPAESYLDSGCRAALQGTMMIAGGLGDPDRNYMVWESLGYRPLTVSGPKLAALRSRLAPSLHRLAS